MNNQNHQPRNNLQMSRPVGSKNKFKIDVGLPDFWKYYRTTKRQLPHSKAEKILKEVFTGFKKILEQGEYVYIPNMGFYGIVTINNSDKQKKRKHIDWTGTWNLWAEQWPNSTREEIIAMQDKPLVYFRNKTGVSKAIMCNWWKMRRCQKSYVFIPNTEFNRVLGRACFNNNFNYPDKTAFEVRVGYLLEQNRNRLKDND